MLRLAAGQVESLWDDVLPVEVKELPEDLAALEVLLGDPGLLEPIAAAWRHEAVSHGRPTISMQTYVRLMVVKHRGVRDGDAGGVGLASFAEVLPDRVGGAGAGRVDGAQAHAPARGRDRQRHNQGRDRQGQAGEAVSATGGADRLHGGGGGCALPDRLGVGAGRGQGAGARGAQAAGEGRRDAGWLTDRSRRSAGGCGR
jgi:hypothetical protein